jgi:selenocysteine-specific elongation factor
VPVVGTAGHVDHGKSTLIQTLTGRDPDRWAEEKERGLTIDLGFAWTTLEGIEVSFVDVPGHERYLKNMLAGIEVIDAALFVVAADEGWMPQSEEHLAVLDLLGIDRAVVALTKTDLVDQDMVELATLEIEEQLHGTSLEGSRVLPVSAVTDDGIEALTGMLLELVGTKVARGDRPRLWIDRSFSISGAGTVATGTLLDGPLAVGDRLQVLPKRIAVRVRGLQSHEKSHDVVDPNRRLAVNLSGVEVAQAPRGSMLGIGDQWDLSKRFSARIRSARYAEPVQERGAYQLHVGSGAHRAEIQRVEGEIALIRIANPLPLSTGDRFIIRDTGRKLVVAGGRVLDPSPGSLTIAMSQAESIDPIAGPGEIANVLLAIRGRDSFQRLSAHSGGGRPDQVVEIGSTAMTRTSFDDLVSKAVRLVGAEHEAHPLRPGIPMATLAESLGIEAEVVESVVDHTPSLKRDGPHVASTDHTMIMSDAEQASWSKAQGTLAADLAVPGAGELGLAQEQLHLLIRTEQLVQISSDLVWLPDQVGEMIAKMRTLPEGFTVAQFRDATGLSRKYAVPFLEWSDDQGLTIRKGDGRQVRPPGADSSVRLR